MMKPEIHPIYYPKAKVRCACGNIFTVGATREEMRVEICSKCHPFYTGKKKLIDIAGRVEKFRTRQEAAKQRALTRPIAKKKSPKESKLPAGQAKTAGKVKANRPKKK